MGKRKKYTVAFRKEAVDWVLLDKRSVFNVGQELGIDKSLIRRWVLSYQKHGIMGLMPLHREHYSTEFKIRVIKTMRSKSLSLLETCIQFNIRSSGALTKWIALYDEKGAKGLVRKETKPKEPMAKRSKKPKSKEEGLLEELASLRAENAYLKKLYALIQADKEKEEKRNSSRN
jgi:transposase